MVMKQQSTFVHYLVRWRTPILAQVVEVIVGRMLCSEILRYTVTCYWSIRNEREDGISVEHKKSNSTPSYPFCYFV